MSKAAKVAKTVLTTELCLFSGFPIYPGRGRKYVPFMCNSTKPVLPLFSRKCNAFFQRQVRPRKVSWTVYYRRENKKGGADLKKRKRAIKVRKTRRSYVGASIEVLHERDNTKPSEAAKKAIEEEKQRKIARAEAARSRVRGTTGKQAVTVRHSGKGR